jgi:fructokinase
MLVDVLKDNHVETKGVRFDPSARTALAFVTLQENGEREFMFYRNPSADMLYSIADIDVDLIQKVILLCLNFLALPIITLEMNVIMDLNICRSQDVRS